MRGPDPAYPESKYVVGVGIGPDLDTARTNARAEISRTFQSRVQQTLKDIQTEQSAAVGAKRGPAAGTQSSELNTVLSTESLLEGVVIKETWWDKKSKKHYALAVLDKTAAQRSLTQQIMTLEETIQARSGEARKTAAPAARARLLAKALAACRERDLLSARRRLVDPAGMAALPADNTSSLEQSLNAALAELKVRVEAEGPAGSRLKEKITAQVTAAGFAVAEAATSPLAVKATLGVAPFDRGHPQWKYYQWKGTVQLMDREGQVLEGAAPEGQEGQLLEDTARAKATDAGEDGVAREAARLLTRHVFGE